MQSVRVACWNIDEGQKKAGSGLSAIATTLATIRPTFVALQEVSFDNEGNSVQLQEVKRGTALNYSAGFPLSGSRYLGGSGSSGVALLSAYPLLDVRRALLPNPQLRSATRSRTESSFDKGLITATVELPSLTARLSSVHMVPFHRFNRRPDDQEFGVIWDRLAEILDGLADLPVIVGGDFNTEDRELVLGRSHGLKFRRSINGVPTHLGRSFDDILFTSDFALCNTVVLPTFSDHTICVADLEVPH